MPSARGPPRFSLLEGLLRALPPFLILMLRFVRVCGWFHRRAFGLSTSPDTPITVSPYKAALFFSYVLQAFHDQFLLFRPAPFFSLARP